MGSGASSTAAAQKDGRDAVARPQLVAVRSASSEADVQTPCDFDAGTLGRHVSVAMWLGVSPPPSSPVFQTMTKHFSGAVPGHVVLQRAIAALRPYGLEPENTIYGQSICPDEINNERGDLASLMQDHWGECFPMGGIGGAPFVGQTGFAAFSHHVPENGHVLILFGPHIAISSSGELGKYRRVGQSHDSSACGAALAAYKACCSPAAAHAGDDPLDAQQNWIKSKVRSQIDKIKAAPEPLAALMFSAYEAVRDKMLSIVNHSYGSGNLVLIGGIQINMPAPYEDHFCPLMFQVSSAGAEPVDLLPFFSYEAEAVKAIEGLPGHRASVASQLRGNQVFSWLGWAPPVESPCFHALHEAFPGAIPGAVVLRRSGQVLARLGMTPTNSIYGQSICPDEINNEKGDLAHLMKEYWGSCFPMGGIGGAPYVGKTGFAAFSHHVPDNGNVIILFGPHVAVSEEGELGKYKRVGQSSHSGACGAVLAAYNACCTGKVFDNQDLDMQETWLYQQVSRQIDKIKAADMPVAAVTREAYEAAKDTMQQIVNQDFGSGHLVLLGGIQINMPAPFEDQFQPLIFQASTSSSSIDLLDELRVR